jgi:hypothetical protein
MPALAADHKTVFSILCACVAWTCFGALACAQVPVNVWKQNMLSYGDKYCQSNDNYYDAARVYYQIADYTKDAKWNTCAKKAILAYRDGYLKPNGNRAAGWIIFPHGLAEDFKRTGDQASKTALLQLASGSAFAGSYPLEWTASANASREVAFNITSKLMATSFGGQVWGLDAQVAQAFEHVAQWTRLRQGKPSGTDADYVRPFMVAITSEALIQWAEGDSGKRQRVKDALLPLWDSLWECCWIATEQTMMYTDRPDDGNNQGGQEPAPDVNLLIAPADAWLYNETKDTKWRDRADALFTGGVMKACLSCGAKQFNENYRWSFSYLTWRGPFEKKP